MFRRKSDTAKTNSRSLSQYGLVDVPDDLEMSDGSDADSDLEAELAALSRQGQPAAKPKPKPKNIIPPENLAAMVAESMRDIPSDEELSDTDDPDILNELQELTLDDEASPTAEESEVPSRPSRAAPPVPGSGSSNLISLLEERVKMYALAEQTAKSAGESSRARRFGRGLSTLKDLLRQAKAGKSINEDEIPPVVSAAAHPPKPVSDEAPPAELPSPIQPIPQSPVRPLPPVDTTNQEDTSNLSEEDQAKLKMLTGRRDEYKLAALKSKKEGDSVTAISYVKIAKQFDKVINAVRSGQPVDLSNMPPAPGSAPVQPRAKEESHVQTSAENDPPAETPATVPNEDLGDSLITASSVAEALQQRLDVYKKQEATAKEQQNSSKARRMGRIVKQFEQSIKAHAAGKAVAFADLPNPPGYAPIPGTEPTPLPDPTTLMGDPPEETPEAPPAITPAPSSRPSAPIRMNSQKGGNYDRQLQVLLQRQKEFKDAAIQAKKNGEIPEAKEYLRCAKGLDPLIDAAKGGLPVDLSTVPLPPQAKKDLENSFEVVSAEHVAGDGDGSDGFGSDLLGRLEEQLTTQLKLCLNTRDHLKALGDIPGMNRFEHLALNVKQDLDVVMLAKRLGSEPPKFHYEMKEFSIIQCNTDLNDNDLELTIVRGLSYGVANPKEVDTYVKFEFPYPQETPYQDKTVLVKDTNSPEYNSTFVIPMSRTARPCLRVFKRHGIKFEIFSRGGFFSRDALIGTVNVKLQPLESQTVLHDTFELMDGRKKVGGQLEVKLRVRHPLLTKQVEQTSQKWLIIDH